MLEKIKSITRGQFILFCFFILCIIGVLIGLKIAKKNEIKNYKLFEKELKTDAENYYTIKKLKIKKGRQKQVSLNQIKNQNLISSNLKDKCTGYVIIASEEDLYSKTYKLVYYPYIKCGSYKTEGYLEY